LRPQKVVGSDHTLIAAVSTELNSIDEGRPRKTNGAPSLSRWAPLLIILPEMLIPSDCDFYARALYSIFRGDSRTACDRKRLNCSVTIHRC